MKYAQVFGFSGIKTHVSPFFTEQGELSFTKNLTSKKVGTLEKTGDYQIKNAQITASQDILGGIDFLRASGTHTHVVACNGSSNADIYISSGGSWGAQSQSLTKGSKVRFTYSPSLDTLFAANYDDDTRSYNGSSWSTSTNVTDAPKAKVAQSFGDRIYLLNCNISGTAYPTRAYRSSTVDSTLTWDTTNEWLNFYDVIVGAGKLGDNMFVGCENSVHVLNLADKKYQIGRMGLVSHESIVEYDGYIFFASYDGFYATNGGTPQKISGHVQEIWNNITFANYAKIAAAQLNDFIYVHIGDITYPETVSNCVLQYDIDQNDWNILSLADTPKQMHTYVGSSGKKLFFGNDDGEIFQLFSSETQNTADFSSVLETNWLYGSGEHMVDDYCELWLYGDRFAAISAYVKVDDEDSNWIPLGEFKGSTDVLKFKQRGYRTKFRLQETGKGDLYELYGLEYGYNPQYGKPDDAD